MDLNTWDELEYSPAEELLIAMAERDLAAAGVEIPQVDLNEDFETIEVD